MTKNTSKKICTFQSENYRLQVAIIKFKSYSLSMLAFGQLLDVFFDVQKLISSSKSNENNGKSFSYLELVDIFKFQ